MGKENSQRELNCCVILQYAVIHCTLESWLSSWTQVIQLYPVFFLHGQYFFQLFLTLLTSVHTRGKSFHCYPKSFGLLVFRTLYYLGTVQKTGSHHLKTMMWVVQHLVGRRKTYCDSNACIEYCHSIKYWLSAFMVNLGD